MALASHPAILADFSWHTARLPFAGRHRAERPPQEATAQGHRRTQARVNTDPQGLAARLIGPRLSLSLGMVPPYTPSIALQKRQSRLRWTLMLVWLCTSFGPGFFARDLAVEIYGWPLYFWMAAQGALLIFVGIVVIYAWLMNRWEAEEAAAHNKTSAGLSDISVREPQ